MAEMARFLYIGLLLSVTCADGQTVTPTTLGTSTIQANPTPAPTPTTPPLLPPPVTNNSLFQCWTSYNLYIAEQRSADRNRTPSYLPYTTSISSYWTWDTSAAFTTLCDGVLRAVNPPVISTMVRTTITDHNATQTRYEMPPTTHSSVDCNFCDYCDECRSLSQFRAWTSSVWSQQPEPRTPATLDLMLPCNAGTPTPYGPTAPVLYPTASASASCFLLPDHSATMYYWPVTTVSGDFCKQDGITVTPTPTASDGSPNTAVYNGITLTSPSAYIEFKSINARVKYTAHNRRTSLTIMPEAHAVTSATVSIHPTDVSSVFNPGLNRVGARYESKSFNWADMNTVPYEVYTSADCHKYASRNCERVWHDYTPRVGIPSAVTEMKEEWKYCTPWGSVDPVMVPVTAGVTTTLAAAEAKITGVEKEEIVVDDSS